MRIREKGVPPPYYQVADPSPATFNGRRRDGNGGEGGCGRKRPEGLHPDGDLPRLDPWMLSSSSSSSSSKNHLQAAGGAPIPAAPGGGCTSRTYPQVPRDEAPMKITDPDPHPKTEPDLELGQVNNGKKRDSRRGYNEKAAAAAAAEEEVVEERDEKEKSKKNTITTTEEDATGGKKRRTTTVLLEGSRCSRVNGRGWRCCQPTLVGYSLCEHHLGKGRLRSMNNVRGQLGSSKPAAAPPPKRLSSTEDDDDDEDEDNEDDDDDYDYEKEMKKKVKKIGTVRARSISSLLDASSSLLPLSSTNPTFNP